MVTYRDTKGNAVELPKLTLGISDKIDEVSAAQSNRERYRLQYEFVKEVCGEEYAAPGARRRGHRGHRPRCAERRVRWNRELLRCTSGQGSGGGNRRADEGAEAVVGAADAVGKFAVMGNSRQGFKAVR